MVECDGTVEVRQRNSKCGRSRTNRVIRQGPVSIVESVQDAEQRGGLGGPIANDFGIGQEVPQVATNSAGKKGHLSECPKRWRAYLRALLLLFRLFGIRGLCLETGHGAIYAVDRPENRGQLRNHQNAFDLLGDTR